MKRLSFLLSFLLVFVAFGFGQKKQIVDDIYVTPNDASMVQEVEAAQKAAKRTDVRASGEKPVYKNGARQIVFLDKNGRQLDFEADTVVVVDEEVMDSLANKDGYYLNGFKGSRSDLEYAERIRRFHNPKYTITIADPGYNDIYFLDDDYWNVYVDGMYATITPTWTNPYWWNYSYSPFGYNSWYWRTSIYYPFGWGGYSSYYPWYTGYGWGGYYGWGGWYDPWYSGYYGWGGYYGWDYPYYGYGYGYPYYGYGYGYGYGYPYYGYGGGYYYGNTYDQSGRRNVSGGRYDVNASPTNRRVSNLSGVRSASGNPYTMVTRQRAAGTDATNTVTRAGSRSAVDSRSAYAPNVNTQTRTGAVRTTDQWNAARSSSTYNTGSSGRGSSTVINRSNPSVSSSSRGGEGSYSTGRSTGTYSSGSRSYDSSRSSGTYSSGSSSVSRSSSSSSGSYSGGGSSSSSGGGGRSSSSSSSGGRR